MGMKTISGILITRGHREGRTVVDLSRNEIVDGDLPLGDPAHPRTVSEAGERRWYFDGNPCYIVAVREFHVSFIDRDDPGSRPPISQTDRIQINSRCNETRLTISWTAPTGSEVEEISYMVTGMTVRPETP